MAAQPDTSSPKSTFGSIMDIFRPKPEPVAAAKPADPNVSIPSDKTKVSDGTGPAAIPAAGKGEASPLEGYAKLWEHAETDGKPASLVPALTADPAKLMAAAKTIDFSKAITPATLEAAAKGDAVALGQAISEAAQAGYAQAASATTKILEAALTKQAETFKNEVMPEILRKHAVNSSLSADNPLFDNPAIAPMLAMAKDQLAIKYPNASAAEITKHAQAMMGGFAEALITSSGRTIVAKDASTTDAAGNKVGRGVDKNFDWATYFGVPSE